MTTGAIVREHADTTAQFVTHRHRSILHINPGGVKENTLLAVSDWESQTMHRTRGAAPANAA